MTQSPIKTVEGDLLLIGTYWPIKHDTRGTADQNLWSCLSKYVEKHRGGDANPTAMLQRKVTQWGRTAAKHGARGTILAGDLNATWRVRESGGQLSLRDWAEGLQIENGPGQIADRRHLDMYTRGGDGERRSWIDHILHKGCRKFISIEDAYVGIGTEWVGTSDHRPMWATYAVPASLQRAPKRQKREKIRWELDMTDRRMKGLFEEAMLKFLGKHKAPGEGASSEECAQFMFKIEKESARVTRALQVRHGIGEDRGSHKDGWSPKYDSLKAQLVAVLQIRRHVTGEHRQYKWKDADEMLRRLPHILDAWAERVRSHELSDVDNAEVLKCTERGMEWWRNVTAVPSRVVCDEEIKLLKQQLQGRLRTDMRIKINKKIRLREKLRRSGKWRQIIKSLLGLLAGPRHQDGGICLSLEGRTGVPRRRRWRHMMK